MAKLLIIDDRMNIIKCIQNDIKRINPDMAQDENTFYVTRKDDSFKVVPVTEEHETSVFRGEVRDVASSVIKAIVDFLSEHKGEQTLILIDYVLKEVFKTLDPEKDQVPSLWAVPPMVRDQLGVRHEYLERLSCTLYATLIMLINKMPVLNSKGEECTFSMDDFSTLIYSQGDSSIGVISKTLEGLYKRLPLEQKQYLCEEFYKLENISWIDGGQQGLEGNALLSGYEIDGLVSKYIPLALPKEYREFISIMK